MYQTQAGCIILSVLFLVAAGAPHPAIVPFADDAVPFHECPDWLQEYVAFHKANRQAPTAKYLVYACKGETHWCGGLGDRIRGIKFALRLAYATRRIFLLDDRKPVALESILAPNLINWTLTGLDLQHRPNHTACWFSEEGMPNLQRDYSPFTSPTDVVYLHTNFDDAQPFNPNATGLRPVHPEVIGNGALSAGTHFDRGLLISTTCMTRVLFRATDVLLQDYRSSLQALFNETDPTYIVMHFRCGGMGNLGEQRSIPRTDHHSLVAFVNGLSCARHLARKHRITHPILVLTDNQALRQSIIDGYFGAHVITTAPQAVHIDYLPHNSSETAWVHQMARSVYADLLLLTGGTCLVSPTRSGFFEVAWSWAVPECIAPHADSCLHRPLHEALQTVFNLPRTWTSGGD